MSLDKQLEVLEKKGIPNFFIKNVMNLCYGLGIVGSFDWEKNVVGYVKFYWKHFGEDLYTIDEGNVICAKVFEHFTIKNIKRKSLWPPVADLIEIRYVIQNQTKQNEQFEIINRKVIRTDEKTKDLKEYMKKFKEEGFKVGFNAQKFNKKYGHLIETKGAINEN